MWRRISRTYFITSFITLGMIFLSHAFIWKPISIKRNEIRSNDMKMTYKINYDFESDSRRQYLANLADSTGSSKSAKTKSWHSEFVKRKICCEKGEIIEQSEVLPLHLYSEVAGNIIDLFKSMDGHSPTPEELSLSGKLISVLKVNYDSEDKRIDAFIETLQDYIAWEKTGINATGFYHLRRNNGPDAFITCQVANTETMALISLVEAKQEIGSSADPNAQISLDYSKLSGKMSNQEIPGALPCLLVTVSGTLMTVQLAVVGRYVTICSLHDGFQYQGRTKIVAGAKLLWAIKQSHYLLQQYYLTLNLVLHPASLPYLHHFEVGGDVVSVKYIRQLKLSSDSCVFEAEVVDERSPWCGFSFIIKFCQFYSIDAHRLLSGSSSYNRLAPNLFSVKELACGWKAIVMEKIEGSLSPYEIRMLPLLDRRAIIEDVSEAIRRLHSHGLVHGDLRLPNVLAVTKPTTRAFLFDFEWTGVEGKAEYPNDLNLGELYWVNVEDLPKITKQHDLAALLEFSKEIRAPT